MPRGLSNPLAMTVTDGLPSAPVVADAAGALVRTNAMATAPAGRT
jgi:hypothetical protein